MLTDGQVSKAGLDKQLILKKESYLIIIVFLHQHCTFNFLSVY